MGCSRGTLKLLGALGPLGSFWAALGPIFSWGALVPLLGRSWPALGPSWVALGRSWGSLVRSWAALARSWLALGTLLGALGPLLGRSCALFGRSWAAKSPWLEREGDLGRDLDRKVALARAGAGPKRGAPPGRPERPEARCQFFSIYIYIYIIPIRPPHGR